MNDANSKQPKTLQEFEIVPQQYVYENLICEFKHWDLCLTGLIRRNDERWFCWVCDVDEEPIMYRIKRVDWCAECDEYLVDYRKAYLHWFHDQKPRRRYDGRPLDWFREKWQGRNPIQDKTETSTN